MNIQLLIFVLVLLSVLSGFLWAVGPECRQANGKTGMGYYKHIGYFGIATALGALVASVVS